VNSLSCLATHMYLFHHHCFHLDHCIHSLFFIFTVITLSSYSARFSVDFTSVTFSLSHKYFGLDTDSLVELHTIKVVCVCVCVYAN
jgi:hypothetical protein